jgi:hypothetical protein
MKQIRSTIVLLCTLFSFYNAQAQDAENDPTAKEVKVKISFSNEYQNERKNTVVRYMLKDKEGSIYTIKMAYGGLFTSTKNYIEKYTPGLKQLFEKELTIDNTDGNDLGFINAMSIKGQPYIFGDYYNKQKDIRYLFAIKIDSKGVPSKPVKIAEFGSERDAGAFVIKPSKDTSKIMVVSLLPFDKKKGTLDVAFTILDSELKQVWKGKSSFPTDTKWGLFSGTNATTVLDNFTVNNDGKVFALIQIPRDKNEKEKEDSYAFYKLYIFENGASESKKFTIDLSKKTIYSFEILETSNPEEMIAVGTYSENKKIGWLRENMGTNGSFFFKINAQTGTITSKSINPFTRKVFEFMKIDAEDQKKGKGINQVSLRDYHITENNNVLLSLEQQYVVVTTHRNGNMTYTTTTYHSEMMFNVKYDPDGKIIYQNFIPKRLVAAGPFGMYHILAPRGERHAMIFNDHRKNTEKQLDDYKDLSAARPGSDKTVARLVTVDETGKRKISTLFAVKDEDFVLQPDVSFKYAPGVIITMGVDGKKFKLIKVEY